MASSFEEVKPAKDEPRFYYLAWQPTLTDSGAVVRVYRRKWGWQRTLITPFLSLAEAWPTIRKHIRARLRHGYRIVEPVEYSSAGKRSTDATAANSER